MKRNGKPNNNEKLECKNGAGKGRGICREHGLRKRNEKGTRLTEFYKK